MKKLLALVAAGAMLVPAQAFAQRGGGWMQQDQTRAEAKQRADMLFQMLDANKDGSVTRAEAEQAFAQFQASRGGDASRGGGRTQRMIDQAFATSQSVNLQQFEAQALARFDGQDLNRDGTVTVAERQQARSQQAAPAPQLAPATPQ